MPRYSVTLVRTPLGSLSLSSIGSSGMIAISAIPGVENPRIESEEADRVDISYDWIGAAPFQATQEHFAQYGLERVY